MLSKLNGYKSYIVAAIAILAALAHAWQAGGVDQTTIEMILAALGLGTMAHKINRLAKK